MTKRKAQVTDPKEVLGFYERHRVAINDPNEAAKERKRASARAYYYKHREALLEYSRRYRSTSKVYRTTLRKCRLKRYYNITQEQYLEMFNKQHGQCAICKADTPGGGSKHFVVDHCHETGAIRELLCVKCNQGLGCFRDNSGLLDVASAYLQHYNKK